MSPDRPLPPGALRGAVDLTSLVQRAARPASAAGAPAADSAGASTGIVRRTDDATFTSIVELSQTVPVIVEFTPDGVSSIDSVVTSFGGTVALAIVDAPSSPQLTQAFQVREVPMTAALVGGRPVPLFAGTLPEPELRTLIDEIIAFAAQNGVTGTLDVGDDEEAAEPVEAPLAPLHQAAFDAISAGDFAAAITAYRTAIAQNPRDVEAVAGLAQVELLQRLEGADATALRTAAAEAPNNAEAQLAVADLDVSGGHLDDAFARLLDVYPGLDAADKDRVRLRLLDFFALSGADDPRVATARRRLTALLY